MSTLLPANRLPVPLSEQMATVWPVDNDDLAMTLPDSFLSCKQAIDHYDLFASLTALREAQNQENISLSGAGPYLLAWSPAAKKGEKDSIVLIFDLSSAMTTDQFSDRLREWRSRIEQTPALWRSGWSVGEIEKIIREWADKWGTTILSMGHTNKE